jgi:hypothetical protein
MKTALKALSAAAFAVMIASPALACNGGGNCENAPGQLKKMGCMERLDQLSGLLAFRFLPSGTESIGW